MYQKIELRKIRDFRTVLNTTFDFLGQNIKPLGKAVTTLAGPGVVIYAVCISMTQQERLLGTWDKFGDPWFVAALLAGSAASCIMTMVVIEYMKLYESEKNPNNITPSRIWKAGSDQLLRLFVASLLVGLLLFVSIFIFIIPFFYLIGVLALLPSVMVIENSKLGTAFNRCFYLVTDHWWNTFGVAFFSILIMILMSALFEIPTIVIGQIRSLAGDAITPNAERVWTGAYLFGNALYRIGTTMLYTIIFIANTLQFYNLVERKESQGLLERIELFGTPVTEDRDDETY